jgi:catechol-2,3-dioxygenase
MIQILYTFEVSQASINADYYEALKSFYKEIINKQTEKIVLKKG